MSVVPITEKSHGARRGEGQIGHRFCKVGCSTRLGGKPNWLMNRATTRILGGRVT